MNRQEAIRLNRVALLLQWASDRDILRVESEDGVDTVYYAPSRPVVPDAWPHDYWSSSTLLSHRLNPLFDSVLESRQ
jgi:hypothetical protein